MSAPVESGRAPPVARCGPPPFLKFAKAGPAALEQCQRKTSRSTLLLFLALAAVFAAHAAVEFQTYPARPVRIVMGVSGGIEFLARVIGADVA